MAFEDAYGETLSTSHVAGYHDQVNDSHAYSLRALLPPGKAWVLDPASDFWALLRGMSYSFLRVTQRGRDLLEEFDPRTTFELLEDWERVLALPGSNPSPPTTLSGRREAVHGRLLGHGDPSSNFFVEVCEGMGYTAIVRHKRYAQFVPGSVVGDSLSQGEWPFYWEIVTAPGAQDAGLTWLIDTLVPEHTAVNVIYLGETWKEQTNPNNRDLYGVAHNGTDLWCAVGPDDGVNPHIITSPDGEVWTNRTPTVAANDDLFDVAHNGVDLWCAVGRDDGVDALILTSPDGFTWTEVSPTVAKLFDLYTVEYGGGLWVAAGQADGVDAYLVTSPDGAVWTEVSNPKNFRINDLVYGGGTWVGVGDGDGTDAYIITSTDGGVTWVEQSNPLNVELFGVHYGGGKFVAVGLNSGGDAYIVTSSDGGVTWVEQSNPSNIFLTSVVYTLGGWVAVGGSGGGDAYILTSPDAETWTEQTNPAAVQLDSVAYFDGSLVAVGNTDGTDAYIATSGVGF